jgi:MYXO-CTERM domain-containing protein
VIGRTWRGPMRLVSASISATIISEMRFAMSPFRILVLSLFAFGLTPSRAANADVAPPSDYVEHCTLAKKQTAASECLSCQAIREGYANPDRCGQLLSPYCFVSVCGAWGGVSYEEIWCRAKSSSAPVVPDSIKSQLPGTGAADLSGATVPANESCAPYTPPSDANDGSGCSVAPKPSRGWHWLLAGLAAVGFAALRGRRSRRP